MVSALFQQEISSLESEVAALQAQIAQAQARVAALSECEADAGGMLQVVQKTLGKVSALAPDALATLKSAVFALFNSDGSDGNGGSDKPEPQPEPPLNGESCDINPDAYWDTTTPDGSSWELATPLACWIGHHDILCEGELLEAPAGYQYKGSDERGLPTRLVPSELEKTVASTNSEVAEKNLFDLISVSATVAYMRKNDGEVTCAYAGFNNKTKAKQWGEWLAVHHSVASGFEVREAKRLTEYKHELKLWSMSLNQIERLAGCDLMKSPPSNYGDAPKRKVERVPSMIEIEDIGVGDTVRSITVKNWQWEVKKINSDGFFECDLALARYLPSADRIGANPPITQTLHPGSVELVSKADAVDVAAQELSAYIEQQAQDAIASIQEPLSQAVKIDRDDVPAGTRLFPISDDLLTEFEVWMQVEVRVMGRTQRQQKQIGLLIQTAFGIETYRPRASVCKVFTRMLDAVAYLIQGSGFKPLPIAESPVLVGAGSSAQQLEDVEF